MDPIREKLTLLRNALRRSNEVEQEIATAMQGYIGDTPDREKLAAAIRRVLPNPKVSVSVSACCVEVTIEIENERG